MKEFVEHLIRENMDEILENSLFDCHVKGLHSIYFIRKPEQSLRLFIKTPGCDITANNPHMIRENKMSVAIHQHHCNISLNVWCGQLLNWVVVPSTEQPEFLLKSFEFDSAIKGKGQFKKGPANCFFRTERLEFLRPNDRAYMKGYEYHTVSAPREGFTAWFVMQGREQGDYDTTCFSNADLTQESFKGMYWRPSEHEVLTMLERIGLYSPFK